MSDEKKLTPGQYNDIIRHFVDGTTPSAPKKAKVEEYDPCYHSWQLYRGLNKVDEFCIHCNKKRPVASEVPDTDWSGDTDGSF